MNGTSITVRRQKTQDGIKLTAIVKGRGALSIPRKLKQFSVEGWNTPASRDAQDRMLKHWIEMISTQPSTDDEVEIIYQ